MGRRQLAELGGEGPVLVGAQVLAREEHHLVPQPGGAHLGVRLGVEWLLQVDTADLGADVARQRSDVEVTLAGVGRMASVGVSSRGR